MGGDILSTAKNKTTKKKRSIKFFPWKRNVSTIATFASLSRKEKKIEEQISLLISLGSTAVEED